MTQSAAFDQWSAGHNYEQYMGRWSRRIAAKFVEWLQPPLDADWLEIGCGTGALTAAILAQGAPRSLIAIDASADFVTHTGATFDDSRVRFEVADAARLPAADGSIDVVASALVLNFLPDRAAALAEMQRILKSGGLLSFYVWDYAGGGMGFVSAFWKAAAEIDPRASELNERVRFPYCTREGVAAMCREAGVREPLVEAIEIDTEFSDFEAFWWPFTLGAGPAPGFCASLPDDKRAALKARLAREVGTSGPIRLKARAWAVKANQPQWGRR